MEDKPNSYQGHAVEVPVVTSETKGPQGGAQGRNETGVMGEPVSLIQHDLSFS